MKKFGIFIVIALFISCAKKRNLEPYSIKVSGPYHTFDMKTGIYEIQGINFIDTILLSENQQTKLAKVFFKLHIDTLTGEKIVVSKTPVVMPDARDIIEIYIDDRKMSVFYISTQLTQENELTKVARDIFKFNADVQQILNGNSDFRNCMDTLRVNYKRLPPLL